MKAKVRVLILKSTVYTLREPARCKQLASYFGMLV